MENHLFRNIFLYIAIFTAILIALFILYKPEDEYNRNILDKLSGAFISDKIIVVKPAHNEVVSSPLNIVGEAKGSWFFEASFPIRLFDSEGNELGFTIGEAMGEWMTESLVPFKATLNFKSPKTVSGILVLERANPLDLVEKAEEIKIPVKFINQ